MLGCLYPNVEYGGGRNIKELVRKKVFVLLLKYREEGAEEECRNQLNGNHSRFFISSSQQPSTLIQSMLKSLRPGLLFQKRQTKQCFNVPFKGHLSTSNDFGCWVGSLVGRGFPINQSISNLRLRRELKRVMGRKRGGVCRLPLTHISTHINSTTAPSGAPSYKFTFFFVDMNTRVFHK